MQGLFAFAFFYANSTNNQLNEEIIIHPDSKLISNDGYCSNQ